eukprot:TRINITY_DN16576_c0_g1_i2.p1 TRINITY_DN16576_c0_g1~~TRINITY_DN16576_c0_g1_i2.p1  ORF type:complete len:124 (+),score=16.02 TRINITY_DN16576_c0_g1_i2:119-490(+)
MCIRDRFEPGLEHALYPNNKYDSGTTCCDLDPAAPDFAAHPLAKPLFEGGRFQQAILGPGDVLYCPRGWFHHVRCVEPSISVNIFASSVREWLWWGVPRQLLEWGHSMGFVGRDNCVCHRSKL